MQQFRLTLLTLLMRTIFYYDMYARHDVIIESACVWLEDVNSIQFVCSEGKLATVYMVWSCCLYT